MVMIRIADFNDLESINEIYNQAVDSRNSTADLDFISLSEREVWFHEHNEYKYPVFVFEMDNKVVGWLSVSPYRKGRRALDEVVEVSYYIHNDYQKRGIGTELMKYILDNARTYNISHIVCILLNINSGSIKLLEKFGFEKWALLPDIVDLDGKICSHLYMGLSFKNP